MKKQLNAAKLEPFINELNLANLTLAHDWMDLQKPGHMDPWSHC
jgi:hypothetical protein